MLPFLSKSHIVQIGIVVPDMKKGLAAWSAALGLGASGAGPGRCAQRVWGACWDGLGSQDSSAGFQPE
jgi:hypothetical protein